MKSVISLNLWCSNYCSCANFDSRRQSLANTFLSGKRKCLQCIMFFLEVRRIKYLTNKHLILTENSQVRSFHFQTLLKNFSRNFQNSLVNQRHEGQYSSVFILLLFDHEDTRKEIWVIVKSTKVTLRYFI